METARKTSVYIVGPITGIKDFNCVEFLLAEKELKEHGYSVFNMNNTWIPTDLPNDAYMPICLAMLEQADAIYVLNGYEKSYGAIVEVAYAVKQDKCALLKRIDFAQEGKFDYQLVRTRDIWGFDGYYPIGFTNEGRTEYQERQILKNAIGTFGTEMQTDVAIEEMAELTKALVKHIRYPGLETWQNIVEEIADVKIMLDQLTIIHNIKDAEIQKVRAEKIARLKKRIDEKMDELFDAGYKDTQDSSHALEEAWQKSGGATCSNAKKNNTEDKIYSAMVHGM